MWPHFTTAAPGTWWHLTSSDCLSGGKCRLRSDLLCADSQRGVYLEVEVVSNPAPRLWKFGGFGLLTKYYQILLERIGYDYGYGYIIIHDLILLCGLFPVFPFFLLGFLVRWLGALPNGCSHHLSRPPPSWISCRRLQEKADVWFALMTLKRVPGRCNESLGGVKNLPSTKTTNRLLLQLGVPLRFMIWCSTGVSRMLCWVCKGFLRISRWKAAFSFESDLDRKSVV